MEIKYEEKVVAFIDVLGFSNLVYNDKTEPIEQYYDMILTDFKEAASKNELKFLMISDSIVVHAPLNKKEFLTVVKVVNDLQHRLILKGILIRGGISFGKLYVNETDNIIVGPGMINAYNLELVADYPRIIIDRNFITKFWKDTNSFLLGTRRLIRISAPHPYLNDFPFVDFGKAITFDFQPSKFKAVINTLKENYYTNQHIFKYEWFKIIILDSVKSSLTYLEGKKDKSKNEPKRIRLLEDFIKDFEKI
jgi:hypothetical protein